MRRMSLPAIEPGSGDTLGPTKSARNRRRSSNSLRDPPALTRAVQFAKGLNIEGKQSFEDVKESNGLRTSTTAKRAAPIGTLRTSAEMMPDVFADRLSSVSDTAAAAGTNKQSESKRTKKDKKAEKAKHKAKTQEDRAKRRERATRDD